MIKDHLSNIYDTSCAEHGYLLYILTTYYIEWYLSSDGARGRR